MLLLLRVLLLQMRLLLSMVVPARKGGGGGGGCSCGRDLSVADLALLQELLSVEGVECSQIVDHGH